MPSKPSLADYQPLFDLLEERTGLKLSDNQRTDVLRTVETGAFSHLADLIATMQTMPMTHTYWQDLVRVITVGETYFFRNLDQFHALQHILTDLIAKRRSENHKVLRLWSAGCASGEEPYSLAMLVRELLPDIDTWRVTILGTDINAESLERARQGKYRTWSFRSETPEEIVSRWFRREGDKNDTYTLSPTIRAMVNFSLLNLLSEAYPAPETNTIALDVILCRNVTIYFNQATTQRITNRFHRALNPEGWLVVGHSEPMASNYSGFVHRNFEHTVLYQKQAEPVPEPFALTPPPVTRPLPPQTIPIPKAPAEPPEDAWRLAKQAADREDWAGAMVMLARAERADRMQPQIYYLRGVIYLHRGEHELALNALRQAIYCAGDFALAHCALGDVFLKRNAPREAARHWRQALASLEKLSSTDPVPFGEEMTVNVLRGLLAHRLELLEVRS